MAYDTKVALKSIARLVANRAKNEKDERLALLCEVYDDIAFVANAEGVVLPPIKGDELTSD